MFDTKFKILKPFMIILGGFIYAWGMNFFIVPQHLFSGGGVGVAQILEIAARFVFGVPDGKFSGIIYLLINIPLLFLAYKAMGKKFLINTLLGAGAISFWMAVLPIPVHSDLEVMASLLAGGIVTGVGIGILLVAGGCGGGVDVIGVWASKKYRSASVGKISLGFNALLYVILLIMFDLETMIYSLIYMMVFSMVMDKVHYQNINVRLMVFTKVPGVEKLLMEKTGRGVTLWKGVGAYTEENTNIFITCINKYEVNEFVAMIKAQDPKAFIVEDDGVNVVGNFEKRI